MKQRLFKMLLLLINPMLGYYVVFRMLEITASFFLFHLARTFYLIKLVKNKKCLFFAFSF